MQKMKKTFSGKKFLLALALSTTCLLGGNLAEAGANAPSVPASVQEVNSQSLDSAFLQGIYGKWQEEGVLDARTLIINADGTYELAYRGGGVSHGTVKVSMDEHPDGSKSCWYNFYEEDGTLWMGAERDGEYPVQTDLYSGHDGAMHFVRQENGCHDTGTGVHPEDYAGIWACGRCSMTITPEGNGYLAEIQWASSAAEGSRWIFPCTYDSYSAQLFCNGRGKRIDYVCDETGTCKNKIIYQNGSCTFTMREGVLFWQSPEEPNYTDIEFRR